jgi:hypothetical protein
MIVACLALTGSLLPLRTWTYAGPLLLFQGLLTLVNTPFNWASIGLTRALLRRGLELGGWWPYILALVNAILASAIVVLLTLAMVIAIQAFGELVARAGGIPFLPIGALFDGITRNPAAPEYWWVYALLLATMSPSLINLMIGGASRMRPVLISLALIIETGLIIWTSYVFYRWHFETAWAGTPIDPGPYWGSFQAIVAPWIFASLYIPACMLVLRIARPVIYRRNSK